MLPADRYTQQTHQSRREKSRAAETRSLCVCVSEERGRGALHVLVLPVTISVYHTSVTVRTFTLDIPIIRPLSLVQPDTETIDL